MTTLHHATALVLGVLLAGTAAAQQGAAQTVQQPDSIRQMGYQSEDPGYAYADSSLAVGQAASPNNQPPAPPAVKPEQKPAVVAPQEYAAPAATAETEEEGPYRLFQGQWLKNLHTEIRGFADVGATFNGDSPANKSNGPVGYNDRDRDLVFNQFWLTAERLTKIENDCGADYGYRVDLLYGADARYPSTGPIGTQWDSTWNLGNRFYGLCMPQMYGDLAYNKLLLRGGHFLAPVGYEVVNADGNFFYSHSYAFLYGQPTTMTGGYATYKIKDKLLVNAGVDTGWNEFQSITGKPNFFFGLNWTSQDDKINVIEEVFVGNTNVVPTDSTRILFNTVINVKLGEKWHYALEQNFAHDSDNNGAGPASWTGWGNYLIYDINDCWGFGMRYEYFEDLDGAVTPNAVTYGGIGTFLLPGGKYNDLSLGLNWKPNKNVTFRTELRWDWVEQGPGAQIKPFDDNTKNSQVLWGNDIVVRF